MRQTYECYKCSGTGKNNKEEACPKCLGTGTLDWIENIAGKYIGMMIKDILGEKI